jgi:predicted porin
MQKKLLAVAVASALAVPAVAQADVTLSGNMDLGYQTKSIEAAGVKSKTSNFGVANGSSTSNIAITATEDLGGGLKAKVYIETDPAVGTSTGAAFANAPNWIELSGNFGSATLGLINNFALTASSTSQPFGTALASGYSGDFGRLDGIRVLGTIDTVTAAGGSGVRDIRANNTFQYKTPAMGGFWGGIQYKTKNSDAAVGSQDRIGQTQIGLGYNNGPLNIAAASSVIRGVGPIIGTSDKVTHNLLGVNYTFGPVTVYGGMTTSKASTSGDINSNSRNIAAMYKFSSTMAAMVNVVRVDDKNLGNVDRNLTGLGLDYSMSKQTTGYLRYESGDNNKTVGNAGKFTRIGVGVRKAF